MPFSFVFPFKSPVKSKKEVKSVPFGDAFVNHGGQVALFT